MSKNSPKSTVVAFKVEEDLASFLNQLPNKSDFIRRAIHAQLGIACPLCRGTGKVSKETHDHFAVFLEKWELHSCQSCGDEFAIPKETTPLRESDDLPVPFQQVVETIRRGGPEYCYTCVGHGEEEHEEK
jgi:hypothetical protein